MKRESRVRVVIPTYNEAENIEKIIRRIFLAVPGISVSVVDDGSPDGTAEIVKRLAGLLPGVFLIERKEKQGLGRAYIDAFKKIISEDKVDKIIMMDADFSHDPLYLPEMIKLSENCDVVVGSRYVAGGRTEGWELWRKYLSRFGNIYARFITGLPLKELTGGFNLISCQALKRINFSVFNASGYAFQIELKSFLHRSGAVFKEMPIVFRNRLGGESKISSHIINEGILAPWRIKFKK